MPQATRDGVSIYHEHERRDGDGRAPVVFVQDSDSVGGCGAGQREAVADEYDVIAPDNRGTGRSDVGLPPLVALWDAPRPRPPQTGRLLDGRLAADLEAVLDDAGIYDAHIVGASMGG